MKKLYTFALLLCCLQLNAQTPFYYEDFHNGVDNDTYPGWANEAGGTNGSEYWLKIKNTLNYPGVGNGCMRARDRDDVGSSDASMTSPSIDCSGKNNVYLSFPYYIIDGSSYFDSFWVEVSNDSVNWVTVFNVTQQFILYANPTYASNIDISSVAANQPAVYLRFTVYWNLSTANPGSRVYVDDIILTDAVCTPVAAITPAGPAVVCSGSTLTLQANTGTGLYYQWKLNGTDITGAKSATYTTGIGGTYTCTVTNGCGTSVSNPVVISTGTTPSAVISPAGNTAFCSGASVLLQAVNGAGLSYQWKKGANLIAGATASSYTATGGGNYKVIVTETASGCSKTTGTATVITVNPLPVATATPQGPTTFCNGGNVSLLANSGTGLLYQWKKGANFISGATAQSYLAALGGVYKVKVTDANGCSRTSAGVTVTVPCREGSFNETENETSLFTMYPNPAADAVNIHISNSGSTGIEIFDLTGRILLTEFVNNNAADALVSINLAGFSKGIYLVAVKNKSISKYERLIIE